MSKTEILCSILRATGILALRAALLRHFAGRTLTILAYHRVLPAIRDDFPFDEEVVSCTLEEFDREIAFVCRYYDVISFTDLRHGLSTLRNPLIITFDDGYKDNHDIVLPILLRHGAKATFFITTGYVETGEIAWWDEVNLLIKKCRKSSVKAPGSDEKLPLTDSPEGRKQVIDRILKDAKRVSNRERIEWLAQLRSFCEYDCGEKGKDLFMDWNDIKDLAEKGMEIGSHSVTHPVLGKIEDDDDLLSELTMSKATLEKELGKNIDVLAYPVGGDKAVTDRVVRMTGDAGYKYACVYQHGVNAGEAFDFLRLLRIKAESGNDFTRFRTKLLFPTLIRY